MRPLAKASPPPTDFLGGTLSLESLPHALYAVVLGNTETHLWFLTMMMGLYLLTPLLRAFVRGASRGDFHWCCLLYPSRCV